jgi:hypothetical protein
MNRMIRWKFIVLIGGMGAMLAIPWNGTVAGKEARPPEWSRDVLDTFFEDAREKLVGPRPNYGAGADQQNSQDASSSLPTDGDNGFTWSKLITTETLESEVKRLSQSLSSAVTTPSAFKGGGYKAARRDFSELAVLFAVTAQYGNDARWQDAAAGLRESFSRAGFNCRVGTDESYRAATAGKQDLADLVRGGRPQVAKADAAVADWSKVAARPPLMQRINIAHQERLTKWLADANSFRRNQSDVAHEAQIVALLAEVIHREEFEFWDDETFVGYANELRQAASAVSAAAASNNFEGAREAIGRATKACTDCHDGYRG